MRIQARFAEITNIRAPFDNNGSMRYPVEYELVQVYTRRDGTQGEQHLLAECIYDKPLDPALKVGPVSDPKIYNFELYFRVVTSKAGRKFMTASILECTQSVI